MAQTSVGPIDCSDKENGFTFWGCKAFHRCNRGQPEYVECGPDEVFDEDIGDCNRRDQVRTPCGMDLWDRCTGVTGPYSRGIAIREYEEEVNVNNFRRRLRCTYFYICYQGVHYGTQKCTGGNVFDDRQQFCADPLSVQGECGLSQGPQVRG
ncbi:uncharacterized protein LOC135477120 [Liolophura sinensis]|uniref:uncharacterized protein LOC135477120 n=1 Tax=Liolophura sinensis TaxID=3198878 RepID=UPI0031592225